MKKNRTMKIATLMLALTLLTCCFVGSTFAKYTSESTGTDSATVALWAFDIDDTDIVANDFTFDLFTTAYELDGDGNVTETADAEIVDKRGEAVLIAPGCGGSVTVTLTNTSEVAATYAVDFTANEAGVPLEWSANNEDWATDPADITATAIAHTDGTADITLYYRWAFSTGTDADTADTTLGAAGTATPTITAVVTVTQAD